MLGLSRSTRLWVAVATVLALTAGAGWWLSRPDAGAWGRDGVAAGPGVQQRAGDDTCGRPGLTLLELPVEAGLAATGTFVADPGGVLSADDLVVHFSRADGSIRRYGPDATLPESAVQTPWTRGDGAELWLQPGSDEYAYVVGDGLVEAWARPELAFPCD